SRATIGRTGIAQKSMATNQGFANFICNPEVLNNEYLARYLDAAKEYLISRAGGTTFKEISKSILAKIKIPLPTLPEQERIVHLLRQADKLKRLRDESLSMAQELFQNLFLEMFGDPFNNLYGFKKFRMDSLGVLDRGVSKHRPRDADFLFGGVYPFIQTGDVTNSGGWITSYSQTYSEEGLAQSKLWPSGTLCITIAANIAKTGILTFDACFPDSVVGFVPNEDVTTEYIMFGLNLFQKQLEAQAPQAAQKNINLRILRSLKIPKPPLDLQKQFSFKVGQIHRIISNIRLFDETFEKLTQQINAEAFSGDLTSNWREKNKEILEKSAKKPKRRGVFAFQNIKAELAPEERLWPDQPNRHWLMAQLSDLQTCVYEGLREWKGSLIPSEDLDEFREQSFPVEHLENAKDRILRALHQLAELGLIARISLDNQEGDYVTAFRGLREDEFTQVSDSQYLAKKG
ncbi:MAG: restriction endonuclease subunit S, partial [Desulfosalsimonadaceae bacterium]